MVSLLWFCFFDSPGSEGITAKKDNLLQFSKLRAQGSSRERHQNSTVAMVQSGLLYLALFLTSILIDAATSGPRQQQQNVDGNHHRNLKNADVTDATANFIPSTESMFDHMIVMDGTDNLSFHWNDISGNQIKGRLIHKADSISQAPTWLGFGVYHSNHDYTMLPTASDAFMAGSSAMIGLVSEETDEETPVRHFRLTDKMVDQIQESTDASIISSSILQHDGDDGTVTTELTFTKTLQGSPSGSTELRREGTNVFLWAVGPPGGTLGILGKHSFKGVLFLDFDQVRKQVEGTTTTAVSPTESVPAQTIVPVSTQQQSPLPDNRPNVAPIVTVQCDSTILGQGPGIGKIALTPVSTFSFQVMGDKIQLALEHSGTHPVWLGVASSRNGYMVGSSAIIGSPGNDAKAMSPPRRYSLVDQDKTGIMENPDSALENASIESVSVDGSQEVTTLKFIKLINDPNDLVPILGADQGSTATFLYAVGEGTDLNYHQHRGQFRVDLSQCGGTVVAGGSSVSSSGTVPWTRHGIFAVHAFFGVLAWAFLSPFAVTVAWFRTLVPASWIYIHVFSNVLTALLTILAFAVAVVGVAKQDGGDHYSKTHHWVGTLLMCVAAFQVVNGFLRPPVERKDPPCGPSSFFRTTNDALPPQETFLGIFPIPRTPREAWYSIHRIMGLAALALGMYQTQSGLKLYAMRFQTSSIVKYYWMYVAIYVISLVALKLFVMREEDKARQGVLQAVSTIEPTPEEEVEADTVGIKGSPTMA
jgi:hypothetical protein